MQHVKSGAKALASRDLALSLELGSECEFPVTVERLAHNCHLGVLLSQIVLYIRGLVLYAKLFLRFLTELDLSAPSKQQHSRLRAPPSCTYPQA